MQTVKIAKRHLTGEISGNIIQPPKQECSIFLWKRFYIRGALRSTYDNGKDLRNLKTPSRLSPSGTLPGTRGKQIWKNRAVYLLLLPGIVWFAVFAYLPMGGLSLAFKQYHAQAGIWGSPWTGLENFRYLFRDPAFLKSVLRTLEINLCKLVVSFPVPVILALMLNELRMKRYGKVLQTVFTFPYFLSWVVVSGVLINILSNTGLLNTMLGWFGVGPVNILGSESAFLPMICLSEIWKNSGWSTIVYIAAITGIDQEQYEAAQIDGASRLQQMLRITLPSILPTIIIMFILATGSVMTSGFDQIFNLSNAATKNAAEVLDMYIYRITFQGSTDFGYSTAVSLFRSVVNMAFLLLANWGAKKLGGTGLFGEGESSRE